MKCSRMAYVTNIATNWGASLMVSTAVRLRKNAGIIKQVINKSKQSEGLEWSC